MLVFVEIVAVMSANFMPGSSDDKCLSTHYSADQIGCQAPGKGFQESGRL